jgi:predicted transposase YbfD/YdcC
MKLSKKHDDYAEEEQNLDTQLSEDTKKAFVEVVDPREYDNLQYPFYGILLIILAATIASAKSIRAMHEYAHEKAGIFCSLLGINQMPGYMAFWWVLTRTNPDLLNQAFIRWISSIANQLPIIGPKRISVDGKALRGAKRKAVHYVSAYEDNRGLLLGQVKTEEKSNEITAIPELLKVVDVRDAIVTIDAMGCQRKIVQDIRERGGHYIIALKGNQGILNDEVQGFFEQARDLEYEGVKCSRANTYNEGHGRQEIKNIVVTNDLGWLACRSDWKDLNTLIQIRSTRTCKGKTTEEYRYYISSKSMTAKEAGAIIRSHWAIENKLHWVLDVFFYDDASRANVGHAAENLGLFRRMAYCLLKQDTENGQGLASKQRKAMWNDEYVLDRLSSFINQHCKP